MLAGGDVARAHQRKGSSGLHCLGTVLVPFRLASHTSTGLRAKHQEQRESEARDRSNSRNLPDFPVLPHRETLPVWQTIMVWWRSSKGPLLAQARIRANREKAEEETAENKTVLVPL